MEEMAQPLLSSSRCGHSEIEESIPISSSPSSDVATPPPLKSCLHRARTAPAMSVIPVDLLPHDSEPALDTSSPIIMHASLLLLLYLSLGMLAYFFNLRGFSVVQTHPAVDAMYFCIVTLCTIGYGDITPVTPVTKAIACVLVLVGFGLINALLTNAVNHLLNLQESAIIDSVCCASTRPTSYIVDAEKGRMRIRTKVGLAVVAVVLSIGVGAVVLRLLENVDWMDAVYLSVMSVTTVGYGDGSFKTTRGRIFASIWLLVSTLAVGKAFLYLVEARINKRHQRIAKWILKRDLTVKDLFAADLNQKGFISKSEFVIHKLKEMGRIGEKEILSICDQFNKIDLYNTGKITLPDLVIVSR
ncbi:hypothetical protein OPV22_035174 [Ensete ventricosum]|uniref:Potassium channel domain-containing protein n=1 Tax=Ensete ventricosum TaxID=4639 RepID=A0AAX5KGD4_ENSVE|nr:hypothetical protein OPV22_035174 [Ensete ventricosum]